MLSLTLNFNTVLFNALVMWALLSVLFDFYSVVSTVITNPSVRSRLLCPKCLSFWLVLLFTGHVLTALVVSFLIHLYSRYVKFIV